jgi:putative hydroxymethylpyrimidine transport system permease protein
MVFCGLMLLWGWPAAAAFPLSFTLPAAVAEALWVNRAYLGWHTLITLSEILSGLALGVTLGVTLALGMILSPPAALADAAGAHQSGDPGLCPRPAAGAVAGLWHERQSGDGGAGDFLSVTSAFFDGLRRVNHDYLDLARSMNASFGAQLRHVRLMAALPALGSGLRMAAAVAPIGAIIGEWVGSAEGWATSCSMPTRGCKPISASPRCLF